MPLCEWPARQGMEKFYLPLPCGVRVEKPVRSIRKIQHRHELIKDFAVRTLNLCCQYILFSAVCVFTLKWFVILLCAEAVRLKYYKGKLGYISVEC